MRPLNVRLSLLMAKAATVPALQNTNSSTKVHSINVTYPQGYVKRSNALYRTKIGCTAAAAKRFRVRTRLF